LLAFNATVTSAAILLEQEIEARLPVAVTIDAACARYGGPVSLFCGYPVLHFRGRDITIATTRMHCHFTITLELWFARGYSLLLIFDSKTARAEWEPGLRAQCALPPSKSVFSLAFGSKITRIARTGASLTSLRDKWVANRLSSFAYLLILNFFADRSFANMSQYPVMPWV
jgi:hypothetical protein